MAMTFAVLAARTFGGSLRLDRRPGRWSRWACVAFGLEKEVYLLGGLLVGLWPGQHRRDRAAPSAAASASMLGHIVGDFSGMPPLMKRLALVQFFSWSALFIMWINTTPVVAQYVFDAPDAGSPRYQEAGQLGRRAVRHL